MSILYIPFSGGGNLYIENMKEAFCLAGERVVYARDFALSRKVRKGVDAVFVNWFEDLNSKDQWKNVVRYLARSLFLRYVKLSKKHLVYVMHNIESHDHGWDWASRRLRASMLYRSDAIMVLCDKTKDVIRSQTTPEEYSSIEGKIKKVSLPNYRKNYSSSNASITGRLGVNTECFVCAFIGAIRPYKRIELILDLASDRDLAKKNIQFVIAGPVRDESYLVQLKGMVSGTDNVLFAPGFIPDEEMYDYIQSANIILLPYNIASSLNSSSAILAFSCGRNVVVPAIGTVMEFPQGLIYSYDYESSDDEYSSFKNAVLMSYNDFFNNREAFLERQLAVTAFTEERYSLDSVSQECGELLEYLRQHE